MTASGRRAHTAFLSGTRPAISRMVNGGWASGSYGCDVMQRAVGRGERRLRASGQDDVAVDCVVVGDERRRVEQHLRHARVRNPGPLHLREVREAVLHLPVQIGEEDGLSIVEPGGQRGQRLGRPMIVAAIESRVIDVTADERIRDQKGRARRSRREGRCGRRPPRRSPSAARSACATEDRRRARRRRCSCTQTRR